MKRYNWLKVFSNRFWTSSKTLIDYQNDSRDTLLWKTQPSMDYLFMMLTATWLRTINASIWLCTSLQTSDRNKRAFERKSLERFTKKRVLTEWLTMWATPYVDLVDLFPAVQEDQKALCRAELSTIKKTRDLALLNDIVCKDDDILAAEMKKKMNSRDHVVTDRKAEGNSNMWEGDENAPEMDSKGHNFARFTESESADVHLGDRNREWLVTCLAPAEQY